jgi:uncharacterized alkaline shock family protein YloU
VTDPALSRQQTARQLLSSATLPCETDVDALLEQVADGRVADRDAHQRQCAHCQAALAELAALWAPVAELAATSVSIPAGLIVAVLNRIRALARDVWYTVHVTDLGTIRIAAHVIAAVARHAARMIPGVRIVLGRSTDSNSAAIAEGAAFGHRRGAERAAVGVLGGTAVVDLAVAVSYGSPVHRVARDIQRHVIATLQENVGLQTVSVNVAVDDILPSDE